MKSGFLLGFCSLPEICSLRPQLCVGLGPLLGILEKVSWFSQTTFVREKFWHHPIQLLGHRGPAISASSLSRTNWTAPDPKS